jgi:acetyl esterase/lipase
MRVAGSDITHARRAARMDARVGRTTGDLRSTAVPGAPVAGDWLHADDSVSGRVILYIHGGVPVPLSGIPPYGRRGAWRSGREFLVDPRLAPEHPFPAAAEDAAASGCCGKGTGVPDCSGSDSAGGNLTLATLHAIRRASPCRRAPCCCLPWSISPCPVPLS